MAQHQPDKLLTAAELEAWLYAEDAPSFDQLSLELYVDGKGSPAERELISDYAAEDAEFRQMLLEMRLARESARLDESARQSPPTRSLNWSFAFAGCVILLGGYAAWLTIGAESSKSDLAKLRSRLDSEEQRLADLTKVAKRTAESDAALKVATAEREDLAAQVKALEAKQSDPQELAFNRTGKLSHEVPPESLIVAMRGINKGEKLLQPSVGYVRRVPTQFSWEKQPGATQYHFELLTSGKVVFSEDSKEPSLTIPLQKLSPGTRYFWRVRVGSLLVSAVEIEGHRYVANFQTLSQDGEHIAEGMSPYQRAKAGIVNPKP
jgi:hypothetical protein